MLFGQVSTNARRDPIASVVIPAYNREAYIGEAIESAIAQISEFPFEVIVADDHSADETVAVARSYGDRVRVLTAPQNRGLSANRNAAIRAALGEFIVLLDDDDRMLPGRLQAQVEFLIDNPHVDMALGTCEYELNERPPETYFAVRGIDIPWGEWDVVAEWRPIFLRHYIGVPSASAFRRSLFDRVGYYDEDVMVWEDIEFLVRASLATPLACYNAPVTWKRTAHAGRMMNSKRSAVLKSDLYSRLLDTVPDLSAAERSILMDTYRESVKGALGMTFWHFDPEDSREVLMRHGDALDRWSVLKWRTVLGLPRPVMRGVATAKHLVQREIRAHHRGNRG